MIEEYENLAEKEGFEPSVPCGTHAFQACQLNHSCTFPIKTQIWLKICYTKLRKLF